MVEAVEPAAVAGPEVISEVIETGAIAQYSRLGADAQAMSTRYISITTPLRVRIDNVSTRGLSGMIMEGFCAC